jgi:CheY-like chemotaxis protein/predicted transcriptional regulator
MSDQNEEQVLYLSNDNIGGQRSKFDVLATILYLCLEGSLKNHIIGKGNFSDAMANHYISILLYNDLLQVSKEQNLRTSYRCTDKGRVMIKYYNSIQQLFTKAKAIDIPKSRTDLDISSIRNILVVEDDADIGSALKAGLEQYGFTVDLYNDPLAMLSSYKPEKYNLLVFDIHMPKLNGFDLYRLINKIDEKAIVCFLTAFEEYYDEFKRDFPAMDMKYFIRKPIPIRDLTDRLVSIAKENKGLG